MTAVGISSRTAFLALLLISVASCGPPPPSVTPATASPAEALTCVPYIRYHYVFTVLTDGLDVGREVRSTITTDGPMGEERLIVSHVSRRVESGKYDFDLHTVRAERTLSTEGTLLRASYVGLEQLSAKVSLVGYNGMGWDRIVENRQSVTDPIHTVPSPVQLSGEEIIGLRLNDHMRKIAAGDADHSVPVLYYDPSVDSPVTIDFLPPAAGSIVLDGEDRTGTWVVALKEGAPRVKIFFAADGTPLEERYPSLHQVRRLRSEPLDLAPDSSDPPLGLYSRTYLGVPRSATHATFHLKTMAEGDDDALSFLGEAENQTLERTGPREFVLKVVAGAPSGRSPPTADDLETTHYITPDDPTIRDALKYLRSGGVRGDLPPVRKENATTVIARVNLIRNPAAFWKDPDKVARLIMRYVYAILPDKRHTFSMADSVETLRSGGGDCTEHSVLFASLMRASGVPTRLVAGLYLAMGGAWVYHMWAEYWDGSSWQPVDPGNGIFRPGALYVALGRGAPRFSDLRQDVSAFLDRAFSGVTFDLFAAGNNGEKLRLARPRFPGGDGPDSSIFNAMVLLERGDPVGALASMDAAYDPGAASISVSLFRASLLAAAGRHSEALAMVASLRSKTSSPSNTFALDTLEFGSRLATGDSAGAAGVLEQIGETIGDDDPSFIALQAAHLFETGESDRALALLDCGLETHQGDADLLGSYSRYVSLLDHPSLQQLTVAMERAREALRETLYSDPSVFATLGRLYLAEDRLSDAHASVDHGLVMAPLDQVLLTLRDRIAAMVDRCADTAPGE